MTSSLSAGDAPAAVAPMRDQWIENGGRLFSMCCQESGGEEFNRVAEAATRQQRFQVCRTVTSYKRANWPSQAILPSPREGKGARGGRAARRQRCRGPGEVVSVVRVTVNPDRARRFR